MELKVVACSQSSSEAIQELACVCFEYTATQGCEQAVKWRLLSSALWLCDQLLRVLWTEVLRPAFQKQLITLGCLVWE